MNASVPILPVEPLMEQARQHEQLGEPQQAEACYRQVIQTYPDYPPAWHALGLLLFSYDHLPLAADAIKTATTLDPQNGLYQRNYAEMCRRLGRLDEAIQAGQRACQLAPDHLDGYYNLGLAYSDRRAYPEAIVCYQNALTINPHHGFSWNNMGSAQEQMGDKEAAARSYAEAIRLNPHHAEAQNNLGALYSEQGKLTEAIACFEAAIAARADCVEAHYNLSAFKTYTPTDPHLAQLRRLYADRSRLDENSLIRYNFALGKALDDCGEYDSAFAAYAEGNRLHRARFPVDEARADALVAAILRCFDPPFLTARQSWRGVTDPARRPIFIVGMPRSGTTLLEQILCSHPSVYGAGELSTLNEIITRRTGANLGTLFTDRIADLSAAELQQIGERYRQQVWSLAPDSQLITDKMPANFFYIGLIHLALPEAKIIHAMRDPMDSCFSCYSRLFNDTMEFAYDLESLGRYYRRYETLMRHWHQTLPPGTILDLPYESLVTQTESEARRILEFVGLPWDPACLEFHQNSRVIKTASVAQVRRPIYTTSVARWKRFARHLVPLLRLVRDYRTMDAEDEALLQSAQPITLTPLDNRPYLAAEQLHLQGIEHYRQSRFTEALHCYDQALIEAPDSPSLMNSRGFLLQDLDRVEEARDCFAHAVTLQPEFAMARLNLAMAQLKLGEWSEGWQNYESRWSGSAEAANGQLQPPTLPLPLWSGESPSAHQRLLIITEQGFGDVFQFSRLMDQALEQFSRVGFVCSQPTLRLMEWSFGDRIVHFSRIPAEITAWDYYCPLLSLPRALRLTPATIPAQLPYLRPSPIAAAEWGYALRHAAPDRFCIGIAWAGRAGYQYNARRSLRFQQLLPLLQSQPGVTWVSLQKWAPEEERPTIPDEIDWIDWTESLSDFGDTAALVANLDLIISVDSVMIHLAGGLNRPVWMMDRFDNEWRWFHRRSDSPWYPQLRIFRQPRFGDWEAVIGAVTEALAALPTPDSAAPRRLRNRPMSATSAHAPLSASLTSPADRLSIPQAMQLASQQQSAGQLVEAEQLLRQIVQVEPHHPHALHLLGIIAWQNGQQQQALELIHQAIASDNRVALFHVNLTEMYRQRGELSHAIEQGQIAIRLDPTHPTAYSNLAIALYDAKAYQQAEAANQQALQLQPNLAQSLNNLGSIARHHKDRRAALTWYRKALAIQPDYLDALSNLGAVLVEDDQADAAESPLLQALHQFPDYPEALCNLGLVRIKQKRIDEGIALLHRSLQLRPNYPEAMVGLSRGLQENNALEDAEALLQQTVALAPDMAEAWCQLGAVALENDHSDLSESAYHRALELDSQMADALIGLGHLRLEQGEIDEAQKWMKQALTVDGDHIGALFHLIHATQVKPDSAVLSQLEQKLPQIGSLSPSRQISIHYALGKAYDDLQRWDEAFPHFLEGARLHRQTLHYQPEVEADRVNRLIEQFDSDYLASHRGGGDPSRLPIFILGMPRSGTTLTEQIIASHPDVYGAGELRYLIDSLQRPLKGTPVRPFPEQLLTLTTEELTQLGQSYVAQLSACHPTAHRITDKMPVNYLVLGWISLLLPNAKIIHVQRHPLDTCLSCFTHLFNRHQEATYDLAELGHHYRQYHRLMHHWRTLLPANSFYEIQYEALVTDPEQQARQLLDYCELEWDDRCLAFQNTPRNIRTASLVQVRQPIYTSSMQRWRHYEPYLTPLIDALGPLAES